MLLFNGTRIVVGRTFDGCIHFGLQASHEHVAIGAAAAFALAAAHNFQQVGIVLLGEIGFVPTLLVFLLPAHKLVHQQLLHAVDEPLKFGVRHGAPFLAMALFIRFGFINEQTRGFVKGAKRGACNG